MRAEAALVLLFTILLLFAIGCHSGDDSSDSSAGSVQDDDDTIGDDDDASGDDDAADDDMVVDDDDAIDDDDVVDDDVVDDDVVDDDDLVDDDDTADDDDAVDDDDVADDDDYDVDPPAWDYAPLDTEVYTLSNEKIDLKIDSAGGLHAAYATAHQDALDLHVTYAYLAPGGTSWTKQIVDNSWDQTGYFVSIALDATNKPYLLYMAGLMAPFDLKFARKNIIGGWTVSEPTDDYIAAGNGLAFGNGTFYAAYSGSDFGIYDSLFVGSGTGFGFTFAQVEAALEDSSHPTVAVDGSGNPTATVVNEGNLYLAHKSGTAWNLEYIASNDVTYNDLCFDPDGNWHLVWTGTGSDPAKNLYHFTPDLVIPEVIDDNNPPDQSTGYRPRIFCGQYGGLYVTAHNASQDMLVFLRYVNGVWEKYNLAVGADTGYASVPVVDGDGNVHLLFTAADQVFYATCQGCAMH